MDTVVRVYLGWRLLRLMRPLLVAALLAAALLAVYAGHVAARHSAAGALQGGRSRCHRTWFAACLRTRI